MKKWVISVVYVLMMFFTYTYCERYRWDDWVKQGELFAGQRITWATAVWPAYWGGRGMAKLFDLAEAK